MVCRRSLKHETIASAVSASVAVGCVLVLRASWPALDLEVFARGAAWTAGLLTGTASEGVSNGWLLVMPPHNVVVTTECSGATYFTMVVALFAWRLSRRWSSPMAAVASAILLAVPVATLVNALRVVAVAQVHRWVLPALPDVFAGLVHQLTGVAIFLPSLIALNLVLETHAPVDRSAASGRTAVPQHA